MRRSADFVAVVVQPGDSLASLAALYLGDPGLGWEITDFNGVSDITPGQELAIPLKPLGRGGLSIDHYQTVPVLSYHRFAEKSMDKMTVSRESFDSQMGLLKARGYRVITLDQLFDFMEFKLPVPEKSVVITIDDGWQTVYDVAYPILRKYKFPATICVYTERQHRDGQDPLMGAAPGDDGRRARHTVPHGEPPEPRRPAGRRIHGRLRELRVA